MFRDKLTRGRDWQLCGIGNNLLNIVHLIANRRADVLPVESKLSILKGNVNQQERCLQARVQHWPLSVILSTHADLDAMAGYDRNMAAFVETKESSTGVSRSSCFPVRSRTVECAG